jgi:hypothetical protein
MWNLKNCVIDSVNHDAVPNEDEIFQEAIVTLNNLVVEAAEIYKANNPLRPLSHPRTLDIIIERKKMNNEVWEFLQSHENNFSISCCGSSSYRVYEIEEDKLYSNEMNVASIQGDYTQK